MWCAVIRTVTCIKVFLNSSHAQLAMDRALGTMKKEMLVTGIF